MKRRLCLEYAQCVVMLNGEATKSTKANQAKLSEPFDCFCAFCGYLNVCLWTRTRFAGLQVA